MTGEHHWQGEIWLARDHGLFAGESGHTHVHRHYAHQVMLALGEPLRLRVEGELLSGRCLLVESQLSHAFDDARQPLLAVYAEPLAFAPEALRAAVAGCEANLPALARCIAALPRRSLDPRLRRALDTVDGQLADKVSALELARRASLSLSQLERLFGQQVGLSVRRLVLWRRLHRALALALQGRSLTQAAHDAGFADSAHLSRSVRSLFGIRADLSLPHLRLRLLD